MKGLNIFMKRNSSTILSIIGGIGSITSTILAVKATPKAVNMIQDEEFKKQRQLTKKEIVALTWKEYIPTGLSLLGTLTCIFGANYLNRRNQASLVAAYSILDNSYKQYRNKAKEIYGPDADKKIINSVVKEYHDYKALQSACHDENNKQLFFDYQTMRYFEASYDDVINAENKVNELYAATGYASVNDLYKFLNIEPLPYASNIGWIQNGKYKEIEFEHELVELDDGLQCYIIATDDQIVDYFNQ